MNGIPVCNLAFVRAPKIRKAFSLVELMIVLIIVAILTAMAVPSFVSAMHNQRVELASHRLASDLEFASTLARSTSSPVVMNFFDKNQPHGNRYEIIDVDDPQKPGRPFVVDLNENPYQVFLSVSPPSITFDIYGHPSQSVSWTIDDGGSSSRLVYANAETGEVSLDE